MAKVIWADDDSSSSLMALARILKRRGHDISQFSDFVNASRHLAEQSVSGLSEHCLLVDIILPRTLGGGALNPYLGLELAKQACERGIRAVCFLTVIRQGEIENAVDGLRKSYPEVPIRFFDKLELLDGMNLDHLSHFLESAGEP